MDQQYWIDDAINGLTANTESVAKEATETIFGGIIGWIVGIIKSIFGVVWWVVVRVFFICLAYFIYYKIFQYLKKKNRAKYKCKDPFLYKEIYCIFNDESKYNEMKQKEIDEYNAWEKAEREKKSKNTERNTNDTN